MINFLIRNKDLNRIYCQLLSNLFQASFIIYLISLLIEEFISGFVTRWIKVDYLLYLVLFLGGLTLLTVNDKYHSNKRLIRINLPHYFTLAGLAILSAGLIWYKLKDLGLISYAISILSGLIIFVISLLILRNDE